MRHNFNSRHIYNYVLSLFRLYYANSNEESPSTTTTTSITNTTITTSSQIISNSILMIQPINDMDTWSTYFWMKNLSTTLLCYIPHYKANNFPKRNDKSKLKHSMIPTPLSKSTRTSPNALFPSSSSSFNSTIASSSSNTLYSSLPSSTYKTITNHNNNNYNNNHSSSSKTSTLIETSSLLPSLQTELTLTPPPTIIITFIRQVIMIQNRARDIIHQLDHLRPSEQFAKSSTTAQSLHQLIRSSTGILRSYSLLALLSIMGIIQEVLDHAPSELKRQVFYKSKLGRFMILEIATILKTFTIPSSSSSSLSSISLSTLFYDDDKQCDNNRLNITKQFYHPPSSQSSSALLASALTSASASLTPAPASSTSASSALYDKNLDVQYWLQLLITSLQPPILTNKEGWVMDWLKIICTNISAYDKNWTYRQEYEDVISIATRHL